MVAWRKNPYFTIGFPAPGPAEWRTATPVVKAHDDITLLGQHVMPESTPAVPDYLPGWFSVDVDQKRILVSGLELWRSDASGRQVNAILNFDLKKLDWGEFEGRNLPVQVRIILQGSDDAVVWQADEPGD